MRNAGLLVEVSIEHVTLFQQGDEIVEAIKELLMEQLSFFIKEIRLPY